MPKATLDERMSAMEQAVRELQAAIKARKPGPDWLDRVIGSMKDEPAFDDVLALWPSDPPSGQAGRGSGAMIALSQGLTLLTRNLRDFSKVPRLVIEDWTI